MNPFFFSFTFPSRLMNLHDPNLFSFRCCYIIRFVLVFFSFDEDDSACDVPSQLPFFDWGLTKTEHNLIFGLWHTSNKLTSNGKQNNANNSKQNSFMISVSDGHCLLVNSLILYNFDGFYSLLAFPHRSYEIWFGWCSEQGILVFLFVSVFKTLLQNIALVFTPLVAFTFSQ